MSVDFRPLHIDEVALRDLLLQSVPPGKTFTLDHAVLLALTSGLAKRTGHEMEGDLETFTQAVRLDVQRALHTAPLPEAQAAKLPKFAQDGSCFAALPDVNNFGRIIYKRSLELYRHEFEAHMLYLQYLIHMLQADQYYFEAWGRLRFDENGELPAEMRQAIEADLASE